MGSSFASGAAISPNTATDLLSGGALDLVDALITEVGGRVDREVAPAVDFWHLSKTGAASRLLEGGGPPVAPCQRMQLHDVSSGLDVPA